MLPFISGCPWAQARKRIVSVGTSFIGILPSEKLSVPATLTILKPLPTRWAENCQNFSNFPFESMIAEMLCTG